ncbi:MAG: disulfide bond formation protein B [Hydrogenovibrio sp.]
MSLTAGLEWFFRWKSGVEIIGICLIIAAAFYYQLVLNELPCPLCLLQRMGLLAIAFGFLLNLRYGAHPGHYALSLLAAVLTGMIALRQVSLHINDSEGFGSAVLGMHMYTWVFVVAVIAIVYIAIVMSYAEQYRSTVNDSAVSVSSAFKRFSTLAFLLLALMLLADVVTILLECGLQECPDDPKNYKWLSS